jgi:elongation factor Ts
MAIDAKLVKQLREETGAAVLDCKNALEQYGGDFDQAKAYLAEKGLATAKKKADRATREGLIETYTHPGGRVGVMLEINCESDFVAKTGQFQTLAHDIALHIAFANPAYLDIADVPADTLEALKTSFADDAKAQGKPENIVPRIVEGRLDKHFADVCLLRQAFVKDDELTVNDVITNAIAELKENIRISRFARFELGSGATED